MTGRAVLQRCRSRAPGVAEEDGTHMPQSLPTALIGFLAGVVFSLLVALVARPFRSRSGPFSGAWEQQVADGRGGNRAVDRIEARQRGTSVEARIRRREPTVEDYKTWRFSGHIEGPLLSGVVWSEDAQKRQPPSLQCRSRWSIQHAPKALFHIGKSRRMADGSSRQPCSRHSSGHDQAPRASVPPSLPQLPDRAALDTERSPEKSNFPKSAQSTGNVTDEQHRLQDGLQLIREPKAPGRADIGHARTPSFLR